jgi:hypothetical protein
MVTGLLEKGVSFLLSSAITMSVHLKGIVVYNPNVLSLIPPRLAHTIILAFLHL